MLSIHVCIKQSVDPNSLEFDPTTLEPKLEKAQSKLGDFEMNALEEAVRLKEKHGGKVTILTAGPDVKSIILREALAIGGDEAYVVSDPRLRDADSWVYANVLSALSRKAGRPDLLICGEASIDESAYQVGPRIAEELGIPSITHAVKLEVGEGRVVAERALEVGIQRIEASLPALVTVGLEINTPRLPSLLMIRAASKKPVANIKLDELGLDGDRLSPRARTISIKTSKTERRRQVIEGGPAEAAEKLISILLAEGAIRI